MKSGTAFVERIARFYREKRNTHFCTRRIILIPSLRSEAFRLSLEGLVSQDHVIISLFLEIHRLPLSGWHTLLGRDRPSSSEPQRKSEIGIASRRYKPLHLLLKRRVYQGRGGTRAAGVVQVSTVIWEFRCNSWPAPGRGSRARLIDFMGSSGYDRLELPSVAREWNS